MAERTGASAVAEALWRALSAGDWDTAGSLLHDDYVQEWPQSGERIVGRSDTLEIDRNFPGGLPKMTFRRTIGDDELAVIETELRYADGSLYHGVAIIEVRDGKVFRETDYFGEPFQAPEWRSAWVHRM